MHFEQSMDSIVGGGDLFKHSSWGAWFEYINQVKLLSQNKKPFQASSFMFVLFALLLVHREECHSLSAVRSEMLEC